MSGEYYMKFYFCTVDMLAPYRVIFHGVQAIKNNGSIDTV
jgi:hypothetical protein